jgi:hypothetical protein
MDDLQITFGDRVRVRPTDVTGALGSRVKPASCPAAPLHQTHSTRWLLANYQYHFDSLRAKLLKLRGTPSSGPERGYWSLTGCPSFASWSATRASWEGGHGFLPCPANRKTALKPLIINLSLRYSREMELSGVRTFGVAHAGIRSGEGCKSKGRSSSVERPSPQNALSPSTDDW